MSKAFVGKMTICKTEVLKLSAADAIKEIQRRNHYTLAQLYQAMPEIFDQYEKEQIEAIRWHSRLCASSKLAELRGLACPLEKIQNGNHQATLG